MSTQGIDLILKEHSFFRGMTADHVDLLAGCASQVAFEPGEYLCRLGEKAERFFVLREGLVSIEVEALPRDVLSIQTVPAGGVLGWSWLFEPYQWRFDARTVNTVHALALDGRCLRGKIENDPTLAADLMKRFCSIMVERLEATRMQLVDMYRPPGS